VTTVVRTLEQAGGDSWLSRLAAGENELVRLAPPRQRPYVLTPFGVIRHHFGVNCHHSAVGTKLNLWEVARLDSRLETVEKTPLGGRSS
jgi:hypothetical protein